jgi:phospholipase D1/2
LRRESLPLIARPIVYVGAVAVLVAAAALWMWTPIAETMDPARVSNWFGSFRTKWYALPALIAIYVTLGIALFPVLVLIAATGLAFGPWLGPPYALAASLSSATTGFFIGRWLGLQRIRQLGGGRVTQIARALERNGTLAVFLMRKVPAPFTLSNVVAGASGVRLGDFIIGTLLGMGVLVVALAGFGSQVTDLLADPSPRSIALALTFLSLPLATAFFINKRLRKRR